MPMAKVMLYDVHNFEHNIRALNNAINGTPCCGDFAALISTKGILIALLKSVNVFISDEDCATKSAKDGAPTTVQSTAGVQIVRRLPAAHYAP